MKSTLKIIPFTLAFVSVVCSAVPDYKIVDTIKIGGIAKWDYLYVDSESHRLYVTHGTQTEVIDTQTDKVIGTITNTQGVHGVAIATDLNLGFTSNGADDTVGVFNLTTLENITNVKVGNKPDAIVYVPHRHKVVVFNGKSNSASVIDVSTLKVVATLNLPGKPEFAVVGKDSNVYFNLEDLGEIASINLVSDKLEKPHSLNPCEEPTGLATDGRQNLFSVCANNLMMVTNTAGQFIAKVKIGSGPDGVAYLDGYAFSANGADGDITVVGLVGDLFEPVITIITQPGARTIAADPATHRLYLPTADFVAATGNKRPEGIPGTFRVLVLERQ
jgi:YVTN family beta-propeller protein